MHVMYHVQLRRKFSNFQLSLRMSYTDGTTETICGQAEQIKRRFKDYVHVAVETRFDGFYSIELLDSANRTIKTYIQNL